MNELNRQLEELRMENETLRNRLEMLERGRHPLNEIDAQDPRGSSENRLNVDESKGPLQTASQARAATTSEGPSCQSAEELPSLLHYLKTVLGYKIFQEDRRIIIRSVYAFCAEDVFELEVQEGKILLRHTDFLEEWNEHLNVYVKSGKSYAAFFAAVTLDLFNKRTFG